MVRGSGAVLALLSGLALILAVAHTLGAVADRAGFAPVVGELLTGLVFGPSLLGVVAPGLVAVVVPVPEGIAALASLGPVFLLVLAGTEVDVAALRRYVRPTLALAAGASLALALEAITSRSASARRWRCSACSPSSSTRTSRATRGCCCSAVSTSCWASPCSSSGGTSWIPW